MERKRGKILQKKIKDFSKTLSEKADEQGRALEEFEKEQQESKYGPKDIEELERILKEIEDQKFIELTQEK